MYSAIEAVHPNQAVKRYIHYDGGQYFMVGNQKYDLSLVERIHIIGGGKGVLPMANALYEIFSNRIEGGVIVTKHFFENSLPEKVRVLTGSHPVPDEKSEKSAQMLAEYITGLTTKDLVFCLLTGGGSSLMVLPQPGVQMEDLQEITSLLLSCGAEIQEINTIRKHLEVLKGGGLARLAFPASLITLILSDVIGNPLDVIASGPTTSDSTTYEDAVGILQRYQIWEKSPQRIRTVLQRGIEKKIPETLKKNDICLRSVQNIIVGDNHQACMAAMDTARGLGFNTLLLTNSLHGEAREAGKFLAAVLRQVAVSGQPIPRPACILVGGETTVKIKGNGKGGRNQELALGSVRHIAGLDEVALISLATDGEDGPTDSAGAVVTGQTFKTALSLGLQNAEYLERNDSYHFFERINASLKIGPTGTNVNDINFLFAF